MQRLGRGNDDSRRRVQKALTALAPAAIMLLEPVEGQSDLEGSGFYPPPAKGGMESIWTGTLRTVAEAAGLDLVMPAFDDTQQGGRRGVHSSHFSALLDEMCEVFRLAPDAAW